MWGSTFADLAKRATELQEQATHLAATKSLFNLDGLQQGKSGDEHDATTIAPINDDGSVPTTTTETNNTLTENQPFVAFVAPTALYAADKVVGPLVMSNTTELASTECLNLEKKTGSVDTDGPSNIVNTTKQDQVIKAGGGRDGWDNEEEDVEEFDFDSSPKDDQVFDGDDKEEVVESILSHQQQQQQPVEVVPSDYISIDQSKETAVVPHMPVAEENVGMPNNDESHLQANEDASASVKVAHVASDTQTEELENVGEPDEDVVFNDEDDGLDDMYDDDDDDEGVEKVDVEVKNEEKVEMEDGDENDLTSSTETENQQLLASEEVPNETTQPSEDLVRDNAGLNEDLPSVAPDTTGECQAMPRTESPEENSHSIEANLAEESAEVVSQELQSTPASVEIDVPIPIPSEPIVEDEPAPPSETPLSAPATIAESVYLVPLQPALPESLPPRSENITSAPLDNSVADRLLEQFSQQMQRLDENHQAELREREQHHALELENALASLNHDKCDEQRAEMENRLVEKLQAKEEQLRDVLKTNEGHKLKIDVLKRELDGTRQLLTEKENAVGSFHATRDNDIKDLERKIKQKDADIAASIDRYEKLAADLKVVKDELESTNDSYSTLKGRVKVVATELKDRRVECRNLGIEVAELTEANDSLKTQLTSLQSQLADQNRSQSEKDEELQELRTNLAAMEDRLKVAEKLTKEAGSVNEKALSAYKKKAQAALGEANARAAAASQAREEAELEARAARSTADAAMERARVAEIAGKDALAEAKSYVKDLEEDKLRFEEGARELQQTLSATVEQLNQARAELGESRMAQDKLSRDLEQMCRSLEAERAKSQELEEDLNDSRRRSNELDDHLETFREELQRSSTATFGSGAYSDTSGVVGKAAMSESSGHLNLNTAPNKIVDKSDAEATIIILQQELHDANRAIRELKETLRVAIEQQTEHAQTSQVVAQPQKSNGFHGDSSAQGNDSTPLYYAMEKQAELNLARDEINRLANLLGDAESSKMEAYEAMDEMRRKMEEAQARLKRFEKMGSAAGRTSSRILNQALSPRDGNRPFDAEEKPPAAAGDQDDTVVDSAVVNLEYLKNVMLSFLNVKTLQEKKALVPVLGAVLCLTAEEQTKALRTIEDTGGIEGVGQALLESFGGRLF